MSNTTHKKIEVVGTSETSFSDAVQNAIQKVSTTVHALEWFEVMEMRGRIDDDRVGQYQVTVKIGFKID